MDEEETKPCPNCKREIPAVNFTIHTVHCARNIKVCPVCKEPVPGPELQEHHDKMHKLLPCRQCGESVCGTDLEDHIRDSCANTIKSCRFCELELRRRELPAHEGYCGARTEQCPDCREFVMIKYQQLHLDSNHGFLRLDDDPVPPKELPKLNRPLSKSNLSRPNISPNGQRPTSIFDDFNRASNSIENFHRQVSNEITPATFGNPRPYVRPTASNLGPNPGPSRLNSANAEADSSNAKSNSLNAIPDPSKKPDLSNVNTGQKPNSSTGNVFKPRIAANFDTPLTETASNISTSSNQSASSNAIPSSSNAIPSSSNAEPSLTKVRNLSPESSSDTSPSISPYNRPTNLNLAENKKRNIDSHVNGSSDSGFGAAPSNFKQEAATSSVPRTNGVKKRTNDQPQINMNTGATKLVEKNLGASRGAVKKRPAPPPPPNARRDRALYGALARQQKEERERREQNEYNLAHGLPPVLNAAQKLEKLRKMDALHNRELSPPRRARSPPRAEPPAPCGHVLGRGDHDASQHFKNLKPMSPTQFMRRFSSLQVSGGERGERVERGERGEQGARGDRFPEIRSSLRELRRGLNEVTAPYNANNVNAVNNNNERSRSPLAPHGAAEERLPCEFCGVLIPPEDLVQHQTGCRPDLARLSLEAREAARFASPAGAPRIPSPARAPRGTRAPRTPSPADPVIPCEFCAQSLPVYAIIEHQERCIRENMSV